MNLADAQTLLLEKMAEHGLVDLGWTMNWDEAGKRFGYGSVGKKVISLSRPLTEANPESDVLDTILHEIAHALADRGVTVEKTKGSFNDHEYHLSLTFRTGLPDGKSPEQAGFERDAFLFGLSDADFHRHFRSHGKTYLLCGFKLKNHTYPIIGLCPRTGRKFKFGMAVLESLENREWSVRLAVHFGEQIT